MTYGHLTVICGPMYGGKTTELLKRVLWAKNGQGKKVLVLKPAMDTRYSSSRIVSHDGLSVECLPVSDPAEWQPLAEDVEMVFFD